MQQTAGSGTGTPAAQTIDAILRLEKQDEAALAAHPRVFHWIGWFVGTVTFIVLQCVFVLCWVTFSHLFPHHAFDEYSFPLLATILALEAVLLTSCVLIRQGMNDRTLERRDHLELQINLLAERKRPGRFAYCSKLQRSWASRTPRIAVRTSLQARRLSMRLRNN
jgi:uncharacterized membrane protein